MTDNHDMAENGHDMAENNQGQAADNQGPTADNQNLTEDVTPPEAEWRRMHPLSPIIQGGLVFLILLGIIFANLRDRIVMLFLPKSERDFSDYDGDDDWGATDPISLIVERGLWLTVAGVILAIIIVVVFSTWIGWRFNTYRITSEAVETRKGVLSRKSRRAPLDRIQSVNLQRPLVARIFGLTRIDVQTGGGLGGNAVLAYLSHDEAKRVRNEILRAEAEVINPGSTDTNVTNDTAASLETDAHESAVNRFDSFAGDRIETIADEDIDEASQRSGTLVRVPTGRLVVSTLVSNEAIIIIFASALVPVAAYFWGWQFLVGFVPGLIALIGVSFARFNRGFRFTISQTSNGVRTGSGLTATSTETIPRHRIHAVDIMQPIGWRFFGWWRIRVTTAGASSGSGGNQQMFQNILLPVGKIDDVIRVMGLLMPETVTDEETPKLIDGLIGEGNGFTKTIKKAFLILLLSRRRTGIVVRESSEDLSVAQVRIRRGFMTRHLVIVPLNRVQSILLARPAVHYMLGLASIYLHTVMGPVTATVRGLEVDKARKVFDAIQQQMLESQK